MVLFQATPEKVGSGATPAFQVSVRVFRKALFEVVARGMCGLYGISGGLLGGHSWCYGDCHPLPTLKNFSLPPIKLLPPIKNGIILMGLG